MPAWPINAIQYHEIRVAPLDQRAVFSPDMGYPKTSPISIPACFVVEFEAIMTGSELSALMTWWEDDLKLGAEEFDGLQDVVGDTSARYQFYGLPSFAMIRGANNSANRIWRVPIKLMELNRESHSIFDGADRVLDGADVVVDIG